MNICIIRHAYFPDDPTVRKEVYTLLQEGYNVDIICLRKKSQNFIENIRGARIYRVPLSHIRGGILRYIAEYFLSFLMMSCVILLLYFLRRYNFIQVNTMPDFLVFSTFLPKLLGTKILLHLHEPTPELWITKYGTDRLKWLLYMQIKIEQLAIKYADRCFTVTESLRSRFGERGANIKKITVIPNVCEENIFCGNRNFQGHLLKEKFRLVTHGLIENRCGHDLVIKAINDLRVQIPNLQYEIIGEGEYKSKLVKLIRELKCEDIIHLAGFVDTKELLRRLRSADIGVVAMKKSPYSELIDTTKMYEYIALRIPMIVSRLPVVENNFDESCVMFFEPGNYEDLKRCILKLYLEPEKRNKLAENAYFRYEKIRWDKTKEIYLNAFQELV